MQHSFPHLGTLDDWKLCAHVSPTVEATATFKEAPKHS